MKDEEIARSLRIGCATAERVRRRCVEEGIEAALVRKRQLNRRPKRLDGRGEAHLVALDWRFTTEDVRIKLKSLYPSLQH